jgi:hypothetical protein
MSLVVLPVSNVHRQPLVGDRYDMARRHVANYPEVHHLAEARVAATNDGLQSGPPVEASYSKHLGKTGFFPEFKRTLLSLRCFEQIANGRGEDYEQFTHLQTSSRLSWNHFQDLSRRWKSVVAYDRQKGMEPEDVLKAAEVDIVLGDMGKTAWARHLMMDLGIYDVDHDNFYDRMMDHPEAPLRLHSFRRLDVDQQSLIRKTVDLAHFGHITHLEGGPRMFRKLKETEILHEDPAAFEFATLVYICDVAGA